MATRVWLGHAPAVAQVSTLTPTNVEVGDVFTATINGKSISFTATAATVENVVAGLVAAWNASTIPEMLEITASDEGDGKVTLTHGTAGVPFSVSAASDEDGSATDEVQTISISGTPTGGTFTLTYDGETTAALDFDASAAEVETALEALSNIGTDNVSCSGGPLPDTPVTVTFTGTLGDTNVVLLTAEASLSGGTSPAIAIAETTQGRSGADAISVATPTAASGPHHWSVATNWSGSAVPANGDDVVLANSAVSIKYGLDQAAVTLDSLVIEQSFTGQVGLPRTNTDGSGYVEYRSQYLAIGATTITIGKGEGTGSGRIKLDTGSAQTALSVSNAGNAAETGLPAILWKGTHASSTVTVSKGSVGVAMFPGETATIATLRVGYTTNLTGDAQVRCGDGVTLTTVEQAGGLVVASSSITTHSQTGGELIFSDKQDGTTAAITTLDVDAGAVRYRATGTLGEANIGSDGVLDFRQDQRPRTVTTCRAYERFEIRDPFKTVTFTNGIDLVRCGPLDGVLDLGQHLTLTPSAS